MKRLSIYSAIILSLAFAVSCKKNDKPEEQDTDQSGKIETFIVNGVSFDMVFVKGGTFSMGWIDERDGTDADDWINGSSKPTQSVTLSDYKIGKFPVTQSLWKAVMDGENPSYFKGDNLPVERVNWLDAQEFIEKLNALTVKKFRLPTESEWEFAARGGTKNNGFKYSGSNNLNEVAWYSANSGSKTNSVGTKKANELGIFDMSGNVWEWVGDRYERYTEEAKTNPTGPITGNNRVNRGGCWGAWSSYDDNEMLCRIAFRDHSNPPFRGNYIGFRLALPFE